MNIENLVRSGVVLAIGLPLSLGVSGLVGATTDLARSVSSNEQVEVQNNLKAELTRDCLVYALTEVDSKLESEAKEGIDEVFGDVGQVDYDQLCNWVLS